MDLKPILLLILFVVIGKLQGQRIAVMGAMDEEIELLKKELKNIKEVEKSGVRFYKGKLKGQKVVLLKAGVGKVNAAYSTGILVANFKLDALIFTGVAGGLQPEIKPGDIVISDQLIQYDFGELKNGVFEIWQSRNLVQNNKPNELYFKVDPLLLEKSKKASDLVSLKPLNKEVPKFYVGTIATGDTFVSDPEKAQQLYLNFNALATEMEGAAVAQICTMLKVPYIVIRSCSDNANTDAHADYFKFVQVAAVNSAQLVLKILENYEVLD